MASQLVIYCDFDGTITTEDSVDVLLNHVASEGWKDLEKSWEEGKIGSRECMAGQVALFEGGWDAVQTTLNKITMDKTFPGFAKWCEDNHIELHIVSDGIDKSIDCLLKRQSVNVNSISANCLVIKDESLSLEFPHCSADCLSGVCKCEILKKAKTSQCLVYIGDGRSDFCCADKADILFAKGKLASYCREKGLAFFEFQSFDQIRQVLNEKFLQNACLDVTIGSCE